MAVNGRPPKYDKDFHPKNFIQLSAQGDVLAQIAKKWDISRETIYAWTRKHPKFSDAVKKGREISEAWYMDLGRQAMFGQVKIENEKRNVNLGYFVWLTKNLFKWSDRVDANQNIELKERINKAEEISKLSDDELRKRIKQIE